MSETNHQLFLEETLWEFSRCGILTDLVFVCSDQEKVAAHKAILSQYSCGTLLFSLSPSTSLTSSLVILPDYTRWQLESALQDVYLNKNPSSLANILGSLSPDFSPKQQKTNIIPDESFSSGGLEYGKEEAEEENVRAVVSDEKSDEREERRLKMTCEVCGQTVSRLREHMIRKHPERVESKAVKEWRCELCEYTSRIKSTLTQHINNIHAERRLACQQCSFMAAGTAQLRQHVKKVHSPANISCPVAGCKRKFVQSCDIKDHIKRTHSTGRYNCHICGKQADNEEKMKRHIKLHNIDSEGLPCEHCHLKFITKQKLREHTNTHTGETPFRCPAEDCGKSFMSSSSLSHHKKVCSSLTSGD